MHYFSILKFITIFSFLLTLSLASGAECQSSAETIFANQNELSQSEIEPAADFLKRMTKGEPPDTAFMEISENYNLTLERVVYITVKCSLAIALIDDPSRAEEAVAEMGTELALPTPGELALVQENLDKFPPANELF